MKKTTTAAVCLAGFLAAGSVQADTIFGVYAGVQSWDMASEGSFSSTGGSSANFAFSDKNQTSYYLAIEHPVPLVPNFRVKHNQMETNGTTHFTSTYVFNGVNFGNNVDLTTNIDLSNTDFIFYYEVFDNDLVSLDIGLNAKKVDGTMDVKSVNTTPTVTASESFNGYVPMIYGNIEVGLPFTGLGVFADGSFLSVGDHTLYDYELGVGYTFVDNPAIDLTVQLGYRAFKLELKDLDGINTNLDFDGAFLGLEAHF